MKIISVLMLLFFVNSGFAYQCEDFLVDPNKVETLDFVAKNIYSYSDHKEFCEKEGYLDLELYFTPHYFFTGEEDDDHYKFMVHYDYKSCTYIYNITQKFISKKSCYSTW